jgi:hypothetical protein
MLKTLAVLVRRYRYNIQEAVREFTYLFVSSATEIKQHEFCDVTTKDHANINKGGDWIIMRVNENPWTI